MKVCIFGLGRIGLPIALVCADSGFQVTGIDVNHTMLEILRAGEVPFNEPGMQELLDRHLGSGFVPKHPQRDDVSGDLREADYVMLAVGTGFARYPEKPDLSTLYSIIGELITAGIAGKTIILRVTLPVGTAEKVIEMIEKKTGLREGYDFWFAFVPERIMEGKAVEEERSLPKIVGCAGDETFDRVKSFFDRIGGDVIRVSSPRTAEFIKLIDNSWRNTRFAFANELAFLAEEQGIDVMEAIACANKGYERNQIPVPGPVSGYCLGKDPYILENAFEPVQRRRGFNSLWYYGRRANDWLVDKVVEVVSGERVLVAGLSFKADIDDYRYSHAVELVRRLLERGHKVMVHDPYLDKNEYTSLPDDVAANVAKATSLGEAIKQVDVAIFATPHQEYRDMSVDVFSSSTRIIDLWNIWREQLSGEPGYYGLGRDLSR